MDSQLIGINLEGVMLGTGLKQCLRQLNLEYVVEDELLLITSEESAPSYHYWMVPNKDPFLIVGHCLLAMVLAWFGGLAAPLVCKRVGVRYE